MKKTLATICIIAIMFGITIILGYTIWQVLFGRKIKAKVKEKNTREQERQEKETEKASKGTCPLNDLMGFEFIVIQNISIKKNDGQKENTQKENNGINESRLGVAGINTANNENNNDNDDNDDYQTFGKDKKQNKDSDKAKDQNTEELEEDKKYVYEMSEEEAWFYRQPWPESEDDNDKEKDNEEFSYEPEHVEAFETDDEREDYEEITVNVTTIMDQLEKDQMNMFSEDSENSMLKEITAIRESNGQINIKDEYQKQSKDDVDDDDKVSDEEYEEMIFDGIKFNKGSQKVQVTEFNFGQLPIS